ncbi:MAG: hypothetical protein O7I42_22315 [Alphaproteobacteria bacterium]|nr:hypothetical protein [Alphaproteobacteria bacterium]
MVAFKHTKRISDTYDESILSAIGTLMLTAALTETALTLICVRLLSHPKPMQPGVLFAVQGTEFRSKLYLITQTCDAHFQQHAADIKRQCKKIERAFLKRNLFAHGLIDKTPTGDKLAIAFVKNITYGHDNAIQIVTAKEIQSYSQNIEDRVRALDNLLTKAGVHMYELDQQDRPADSARQ